jgi:two-component system sensor histidine kinase KdpD
VTTVVAAGTARVVQRARSEFLCRHRPRNALRAQTPSGIDSAAQHTLVDNIQLAQAMGAEVVKLEGADVVDAILQFAVRRGVTLVVVGQRRRSRIQRFLKASVVDRLVNNGAGVDVLVVSFDPVLPHAGRSR